MLIFVQGEGPVDSNKGVIVILQFAKYDKGGCENVPKFSAIAEKHGADVQVIGVMLDPEQAHVERFLQKAEYKTTFPLAYDPDKNYNKALKKVSGLAAIGVHAFIAKDGVIVWRQQLSQTFQVDKSNFEEQLERVIKGEELAKGGPRPEEEEEEESSDDGVVPDDGDMSLF